MVECKNCKAENFGKAAGKNCSECGQPLETAEEKAKREARNKRARNNARERDAIMRSMGLTKVKGAVSGQTYWE